MALVQANQTSSASFIPGTVTPAYSVSGDTTFTAAQSGSIVLVSKAAAYTITLPAPTTAGLRFTFLGGATDAKAVTINCGAGLCAGMWRQVNGTATVANNKNSISFTASSVIGDRIEAISDGAKWQVQGSTGVADGMAFAPA